jgi:hypothetical protein
VKARPVRGISASACFLLAATFSLAGCFYDYDRLQRADGGGTGGSGRGGSGASAGVGGRGGGTAGGSAGGIAGSVGGRGGAAAGAAGGSAGGGGAAGAGGTVGGRGGAVDGTGGASGAGGTTGAAGVSGQGGTAATCRLAPGPLSSGACAAVFNFESSTHGAIINSGSTAFTSVARSNASTYCGNGALAISALFGGTSGATTKGEVLINLPGAPVDLTGKSITVRVAADPGCSADLNFSLVLNTQSGAIYFTPVFPLRPVTNSWSTATATVSPAAGTTTGLALSLQAISQSGYQGTIYVDEIDITSGPPGIDSGMVLRYRFDESSGSTAADSSGNGRNGTLTTVGSGTATFSTTRQVGTGALSLMATNNANGAYVSLPASLNAMGATTAITIATWVNITTDRPWAKVFDFNNSSTTGYMTLTTYQNQSTPNSARFTITTTTNTAEQLVASSGRLSIGVWHHIAVVLGAGATTYTGTLYIDGAVAGTNDMMTLRPSNLGSTVNNWLGRSAYAADPLFSGLLDDFRIYNRPLSASEIAALYALR